MDLPVLSWKVWQHAILLVLWVRVVVYQAFLAQLFRVEYRDWLRSNPRAYRVALKDCFADEKIIHTDDYRSSFLAHGLEKNARRSCSCGPAFQRLAEGSSCVH